MLVTFWINNYYLWIISGGVSGARRCEQACAEGDGAPLLPAEHIRPAFEQLVLQVADRPVLLDLLSYVGDTWITSTIWPIPSWSVYNKTIRTNNDCEGWHSRMNVDRAQVCCLLSYCYEVYIYSSLLVLVYNSIFNLFKYYKVQIHISLYYIIIFNYS